LISPMRASISQLDISMWTDRKTLKFLVEPSLRAETKSCSMSISRALASFVGNDAFRYEVTPNDSRAFQASQEGENRKSVSLTPALICEVIQFHSDIRY
jgi:hypothetical protein